MSRVILAYPSWDPGWIGPPSGAVVMDAEPCIWPGSVVAPDPQRLEEAARFLASQARPDDVLFSLSETGLLACARAAELVPGLRGLRVAAAVRCVDRRALRRTLDPAGEGQRWAVDEAPRASGPYVVKAAASAASNGVRIVEDAGSIACAAREAWACARPELERLRQVAGDPQYKVIVESFVPGEQCEVSGALGEGGRPLVVFTPLIQRWDRPAGRILRYEPAPAAWRASLRNAALSAVSALGLEWCGFCVELRGECASHQQAWHIVEVNARLGADDEPYFTLLAGGRSPFAVLVHYSSLALRASALAREAASAV